MGLGFVIFLWIANIENKLKIMSFLIYVSPIKDIVYFYILKINLNPYLESEIQEFFKFYNPNFFSWRDIL